jgi:hypothetical protein
MATGMNLERIVAEKHWFSVMDGVDLSKKKGVLMVFSAVIHFS